MTRDYLHSDKNENPLRKKRKLGILGENTQGYLKIPQNRNRLKKWNRDHGGQLWRVGQNNGCDQLKPVLLPPYEGKNECDGFSEEEQIGGNGLSRKKAPSVLSTPYQTWHGLPR